MIRSGALTLGTVLMLGAVSRADGADVSALAGDWTLPSFFGLLPTLPENWSDLPVQFKLSESLGYSDNVLNTPKSGRNGVIGSLVGRPVGSFQSVSNYGISTKWYLGGQQFFVDASYGMYRYLKVPFANRAQHALDAGVNWTYTSKCTGKLIASEATAPALPGQQVGFNVINSTTTIAFNETANCRVSGNWGAILNSGTTQSTNSALVDQSNNFQNVFVAAGMSYSVSETNTLQLLATVTGWNYNNRDVVFNNFGQPVSSSRLGLVNKFTEDQINLSYTRNINPNLAIIGSIGAVGIIDRSFAVGIPSGIKPQYTLSVKWTITPKLDLTGSVARVATPPTSVISNLQVAESAGMMLAYRATPKITLSANALASRTSGAFTPVSGSVNTIPATQNSTSYNAGASLAYTVTPFLGASLSYQYIKTVQANIVTPTNLVMLNVNFAPY